MEKKPSDINIHQAASWYARLRAPDCGPAERRAFQVWLESDSSHAQAYESAVRAARLVSGHLLTDPRLQALAAAALDECPAPQQRPRTAFLPSSLRYAAALVVAVGLGLFFATLNRSPVIETRPTALYANSGQQIKQIPLADGSTLHLDAGARVSVSMGPEERQLILLSGRAYFAVAPDKLRPFSVSASGARVVALGTQFQVEILDNQQAVNVTLAEGSVAVIDNKSPLGWREVLVPGQQLQIDHSLDRHQTIAVDVAAVTSWSSGRLIFDGMPLYQVLDEVNRYASTKVILGDSALADIPIGGNFVAGGDTAEFVETLAAALPLRTVRTGANEIALFQRYETDRRYEVDQQ
jgi:transmembrane sensor